MTCTTSNKCTQFRWFIVALLFFITIVNYIDRSAIAFALDKMETTFHLSDLEVGMILGAFGIGYAVTTFLGGIVVDKSGPRKVMTIAVILWGVSMFVTAAASGFLLLFISRVLLGVSEGPNFPSVTRSVADWLPAHERASSLAYALIAVPIAIAIGAPIVTQLLIYLSWRSMFVVLGALALVWVPIWLIYFRNNPKESKYVNAQEYDIIDDETKSLVRHDKKVPANVWRYLLTDKTLLANYWAFFVFGYFLFFFMGWLPLYFTKVYHMSLKQEGLFTMLPWLLAAAFMWIVGHISDYLTKKTNKLRLSRSYPIMISQLLASLSVIPIVLMNHPNLITVVILISLAVAFSMSANPNYYAINIDMAKKRAGTALGIMDTGFAIAGFIAPVLTGYLVNITGSFDAGFALLVILGLSSVIIVALFHKPD